MSGTPKLISLLAVLVLTATASAGCTDATPATGESAEVSAPTSVPAPVTGEEVVDSGDLDALRQLFS